MKTLIDKYLQSLVADGKSEATAKTYKGELNKFERYFADSGKTVETIKFSDLREWSNALAADGLSAASRALSISTVKSFFKYLCKMEYIEKNPAEFLEAPKLEKKQPKVISAEDASEILFCARNGGNDNWKYMRDLAIVMVFLYTGVRREELTNIALDDIDFSNDIILIHGKGNKQRHVFIGGELKAVLSEYLKVYRKHLVGARNSDYLFCGKHDGRISIRTVNYVVDRFMEQAGCKAKGVSCHQLRKRFATSVYEQTNDVLAVQRLLGHSSPTVTQRYIANNDAVTKKAAMTVSF